MNLALVLLGSALVLNQTQAQESPSHVDEVEVQKPPQGIAIGTASTPSESPVQLKLVRRFQSYQNQTTDPSDSYDSAIHSPKSAHFSRDGKKVYVNSLENMKTLVYDTTTWEREVIEHEFDEEDRKLFFGFGTVFNYRFKKKITGGKPNIFGGKPVESELTHRGRYLWVPYYRRSFDELGQYPSAIAVIDTKKDEIVRVMPTGPIAKGVAASPDGRFLAISHWGDNTVALLRIRSNKPSQFKYYAHLIVEKQADLKKVGVNRDQDCGFCLRGLAFSKSGRYLFVARMGDGGIAVFQLPAKGLTPAPKYLGSVYGFRPKPRDLHVSQDGKSLYMSAHATGYVSKVAVLDVVNAAKKARKEKDQRITMEIPHQEVEVGLGARTIKLSPDEKYLFVAVNGTSQLVVVETETFKVVSTVAVDPYPVGLDLSKDGKSIWVTSQGRSGYGGNSISIYEVAYASSGHH